MKRQYPLLLIFFSLMLSIPLSAQNNQVLSLDGLSSYVEIPDNAALDLTNNFTVEAWVKTCDTSLNQLIVEKKWCSGAQNSFYFAIIKGSLRWLWDNDGYCANQPSSYMTTDKVIIPNVWTHCAVVHTADSVNIFVNGVKAAGYLEGGQYSVVYQSNSPMRIGAYRALAGDYGMYFKGFIDDVRIWNRIKTPMEIANQMNDSLSGAEANLVACYDMNLIGTGQNVIVPNKSTTTGSIINGLTAGSGSYPAFVNETVSFDGCRSIPTCSRLEVLVNSTRRRRCFRNTTAVKYSNAGSLGASNVVVTVIYPDYVTPLSSSMPWTGKAGNKLTYNIGTLNAQQSGTISITDSVSCIAGITGFTQCTEARISPANTCIPVSTQWDKSSITVTGSCNNGMAKFYIINNGSGNMESPSQYRVYFDDTLGYASAFTLPAGDTLTVDIEAMGQTIRVEADQHPQHPGHSHPRASVEGCGVSDPTFASKGHVLTYVQDDEDDEKAISCLPIIDSFDPNDKAVFPAGLTSNGYIKPGDDLEYIINFQNTGSDTAYTVVVIDTLSEYLDISTLTMGICSHTYSYSIVEKGKGIVTFTFYNINLPDSSTNLLESQGYINFKIKQKSGLATDSKINNQAHIFFDYNMPVATNITVNTVHDTLVSDLNKSSRVSATQTITGLQQNNKTSITWTVSPNPFNDFATFENGSQNPGIQQVLYIYDSYGNQLSENPFIGNSVELKRKKLASGIYFYKISENNIEKSRGKIIITD